MKNSGEVASLVDEEPASTNPSAANLTIEDDWQTAVKHSVTNIKTVSKVVVCEEESLPLLERVARLYHMRIPQYYLSLIKNPFDVNDPIRKQCMPSVDELMEEKHEKIDPLGEEETSPLPCLVHRYPDRVLLLVTNRCFMYCRHCTRKRIWKSKCLEPTLQDIDKALSYIARKGNANIREVILSGGDPLILETEKLDYILSAISKIPNIEAIRIGTRAPVVMPQRIDDSLLACLEKYEKLWINLQFNHPQEISQQAIEACRKLEKCGIPLSNQSVLLKGINDDTQVMMELCHKLQSIRVRPYYLFQCDPVVGATHFRTSVFKGIEIMEKMRGNTGGMCIPTFVVDGTEGRGKVPLAPNYLVSISEDEVVLRNYNKECFPYYNPKRS